MSTSAPQGPLTAGVPTDGYRTFGPLFGADNVRAAALAQLANTQQGVVPYLIEVERQRALNPGTLAPPLSSSSFRAGIDFNTYASDDFPLFIAVVEPYGDPERYGGGEYAQWFELQIASIVRGSDEQEAIYLADAYGVAVCGSILQEGSLDTEYVVKTNLSGFPRTEFVAPTAPRTMVRSVATFHVLVQPVFAERYQAPPANWPFVPPTYPTVKQVNTKITSVQTDSDATDGTVTATVPTP